MKHPLAIILLAGAFNVCYAQTLIQVPGSNVYIDPNTNKIYPRAAPNVAIDPDTGEAITPGSRRAAAPQPSQAARSNMNCSQLQSQANRLSDIVSGMQTDQPQYAGLYNRLQETRRRYVYECE